MIGFHSSRSDGKHTVAEKLTRDIKWARDMGIANPAFQIFAGSPLRDIIEMTDKDIAETAALIRREKVGLVIHAAYVDLPWRGSSDKPQMVSRSCAAVADKLALAARLSYGGFSVGVVVHLSRSSAELAIDVMAEIATKYMTAIAAADTAASIKPTLWLEINVIKAESHTDTFADPGRLRSLFDSIADEPWPFFVGLCIDTAHIHSCGRSMSTYNDVVEYLTELGVESTSTGDIQSFDNPIMLHLNDSELELGCGRDRHAALTAGYIWGNYAADGHADLADSGLAALMKWVVSNNITVILERQQDDIEADVRILKRLIGDN